MTHHSDRDGSERRASCGARVCSVDYTHGEHEHTEHGIKITRWNEARDAAPAGAPLHEATDRDGDGVEERVREMAEAIRSVSGGGEGFWSDEARACVVVEDRHMAELRAQLGTMSEVARHWERKANEIQGRA